MPDAASAMASDAGAPTTSTNLPADGAKRGSTTQDLEVQRKDRSFQDCIELLMPVYLLPLVFGDKEGACVYCVVLTVVGLMGRVLPSPVAAMLPIVILPLGDVYGVDQLAAAYLSPHVLSVSLLFAVAIIGDETTIFFRMCLYVLERYALRVQPLFVGMHLLVFTLSLILPSSVIVIFSTFLIDRFVTTIHDEIVDTDQRSGVRIRAGSGCAEAARRPRCWRTGGASARRSRSVSIVSKTSEVSGSSSVVRQFKMHPELRRLEAQEAPRRRLIREPHRTSFGVTGRFQRGSDDRTPSLPVRRIRSLSVQPKRLSSILKHNSATPPPLPSPRAQLSNPLCLLTSPSQADTGPSDEMKSPLPMSDFHLTSPTVHSGGEECREVRDQVPMLTTDSSRHPSVTVAPSAFTALQCSSVKSPEGCHSAVVDASSSPLPSPVPDRPCAPRAVKSSPPAKRKGSSRHHPSSPRKSKDNSKPGRAHEVDASSRTCEGNKQTHSLVQKNAAINACVPSRTLHQPSGSKASETEREEGVAPPTSKSMLETAPDPNPEAKPGTEPVTKSTYAAVGAQESPESVAVEKGQEPRPEVRGVLKKRYPSIQPSSASRSGSVLIWGQQVPIDKDIGDRASRSPTRVAGASGAEQQMSLRVRALTTIARPAFIASAAYTAIFGNIASFTTLPTRKTVLVTLGCRDDICPVSWESWLAVSLPVSLMCCIVCWASIYSTSLVHCEDDFDEQAHKDLSKCARLRHQSMKRHTAREALVFYWLMGIPVASSAYSTHHPGRFLEVPLLGLTLLVLSVVPGSLWRHWWSNRALNWRSLCSRMPWNIIFMLGSIMALTITIEVRVADASSCAMDAQQYRLVEFGLNKLDDQFWAQRSTKSSQFILVSLAAVLSELVVGESLAKSMAPTVVRVAVMTKTPVSFYVVPVSLAASINVMLPVSLPLLVMREYMHTKSAQMVAYGVFLKCIAVTAIFISMNTIGLIVFQGHPLPKDPAIRSLNNSTDIGSL